MEKDLEIMKLGEGVNYIYSRDRDKYSFKKIEELDEKNERSFKELENELKNQGRNYKEFFTMLPEHGSKIVDIDKIATNESKMGVVDYNKLKVLYPKISADGIYTEDLTKGIILCPADCMAVGILDLNRGAKALIHSGWKGLLEEISIRCVNLFKMKGSNISDLKVIIGPSISKENFIVKDDIIDLFNEYIEETLGEKKEIYISRQGKGSYNVDLRKMLIKTLYNRGIKEGQILSIEEDTYSSKQNEKYRYHSYRRDKGAARRNIVII